MWDPRVWSQRGSFQNPVPIPVGDPAVGPFLTMQIEPTWLPVLLGAAEQLLQPSTWDTTDPALRLNAQMNAMEMIFRLGEATMLDLVRFQFTEGCGLQFSTDTGTTWEDVPGWADYAHTCFAGPPGAQGIQGETGAPGIQGETGAPGIQGETGAPGIQGETGAQGIQGETGPTGTYTPGAAPNPAGNTVSTQACNIAYYMSHSVVETALTQAVAKLNDDASTATFALAVIALIPGVDVIEAVMVGALGAVYLKVQRDAVADYETALADGALWDAVTCAMFGAIETDGSITADNYASLVAAVSAVAFASTKVHDTVIGFLTDMGATGAMQVQSMGVLTYADCTGCGGPWCYTFDFTTSEQGWSEQNGNASYTAGIGWQGVQDGTHNVLACEIGLSFTLTQVNEIEIIGTMPYDDDGGYAPARSISCSPNGPSPAHFTTASGAIDATLPINQLTSYVQVNFDTHPYAGSDCTLTTITLRGTGPCPFGTSNC